MPACYDPSTPNLYSFSFNKAFLPPQNMDDIPSYLSILLLETEGVSSAGWTMTVLKLLVVLVLVAINGFFVAAEFALVGVRRSRIETLASFWDRAAKRLISLLDNLNAYLSASQLGITLASLALGWVGEPTVASLLETPFAGMSDAWRHGLHSLLHSQSLRLYTSCLVNRRQNYWPGTRREDCAGSGVTHEGVLLGLPLAHPSIGLGQREYRQVVRAESLTRTCFELYGSRDSPAYRHFARERSLARGRTPADTSECLSFQIRLVREAMVPRTEMAAIPANSTLAQITKAFEKHRYSRLPVYRESLDDVIGFIHSKDVMPYLLRPDKFRLEDVLQPPALCCGYRASGRRTATDAKGEGAFRFRG